MEKVVLSRRDLEAMSTADLVSLAEDFGIEVPENLGRGFIIGELLDAARESEDSVADEQVEEAGLPLEGDALPQTYNETFVGAIMRTPAWAFVFWDFKEADLEQIAQEFLEDGIYLHVSFFKDGSETPADVFDVQVPLSDRERYVLIPPLSQCFEVELVVRSEDGVRSLARSRRKVALPDCSDLLSQNPGQQVRMTNLERLSGMPQALHEHYMNHRQSFS